MNYLNWSEKTITDFSPENINKMYAGGFVFTRLDKGVMQQTRSVRIDLSKFLLTSENRRILKKVSEPVNKKGASSENKVGLKLEPIPLPFKDYNFSIGKLAKDFYEKKFGPGIMSAQKVKEMLTDGDKSNFNVLLTYITKPKGGDEKDLSEAVEAENEPSASRPNGVSFESLPSGFAICYVNKNILHYSYPFYNLETSPKDMGLAMMITAIQYAKENGLKYVYLGSLQRPTDTYKLQFEGLEWFDGKNWQTDIEEVKKILK